MAVSKKVSPAVHKAGQSLRRGSSVAGLAESERAKNRELKAEIAELKSENRALRNALKQPTKRKP